MDFASRLTYLNQLVCFISAQHSYATPESEPKQIMLNIILCYGGFLAIWLAVDILETILKTSIVVYFLLEWFLISLTKVHLSLYLLGIKFQFKNQVPFGCPKHEAKFVWFDVNWIKICPLSAKSFLITSFNVPFDCPKHEVKLEWFYFLNSIIKSFLIENIMCFNVGSTFDFFKPVRVT